MNILIIGNGFDLAHGLPTKYTDFLEYVKEFQFCHNRTADPLLHEFDELVQNNV